MPGDRALERAEAAATSRSCLSLALIFLMTVGPLLCALPAESQASGAARAASDPPIFVKYAGNPVLGQGDAGAWDSASISGHSVLIDNGMYMLWYGGSDAPYTEKCIGLATSADGLAWARASQNPVLGPGATGQWDSSSVANPVVLRDGPLFKMWYAGGPSDGSQAGYATSPDGINWTRYAGNPVLGPGAAGDWDSMKIVPSTVLKDDGGYRMWYHGDNGSGWQVGLAFSPDGVSWSKYAGNPVLWRGAFSDWDGTAVACMCVINVSGVYRGWYQGHYAAGWAIGYASSDDGINWTKHPGNPVLGPEGFGWENHDNMNPWVLYDGTGYRMWYTGVDSSTTYWTNRFGYAGSGVPAPPVPTGPAADAWITERRPRFTWNFTDIDGQNVSTAFEVQLSADASFSPVLGDSGKVASAGGSHVPDRDLPDGTYFWRVRAWDEQGVSSGWSPGRRVRIDATPPENPSGLSSSSHGIGQWSVVPRIEVGWSVPPDGDLFSGYGGFATAWDNSASTIPGGTVDTTSNAAISPPFAAGDGIYFHVRARDRAGNWNLSAAHLGPFRIDTGTPDNPAVLESTSHAVGAWSSDNTVDMEWSGEAGTASGVDGYSASWDNSAYTVPPEEVVLAGDAGAATSPALADGGSWYFHLRVKDRAGTWNMTARHSGPYRIDTTPPDNPSGLAGVGASPRNWSANDVVTVSWSGPGGDLSGVSGYSVLWDRSPRTLPDGTDILAGDALQARSPPLSDGKDWYFHIRARDWAGNWNRTAVHLGPFWVDAAPPGNPKAVSSPTHSPDVASGETAVEVSWPAGSDVASGVAGYAWSWDDRPDTVPPADPVSDAGTLSASSGPLPDGRWYFHLRTVDAAGNWAPGAVHGGPYVIDRSIAAGLPPVITSATGVNNTNVSYGTELRFTAWAYSPDSRPLTYSWNENGEVLGTGSNFTRTFPPGRHSVVLVVSDGRREATRTFDFFVQQEPGPPARRMPAPVALSPYMVSAAILLPLGFMLLALARTEIGKFRLWTLFFILYTRLGRDEVLDNELRGMIRGFIQADPGIHYNALLRQIEAGNGTVAHHLMVLEREGIIKSRRDGGLRRFYPGEMKLTEVHVRLSGVQKLILDQVRRKEGQSQRTVAAAIDIPYLTVNRQVRKMVSLGVLRLEWRGISSKCYVGDGWREGAPELQAGADVFLQTMSTRD